MSSNNEKTTKQTEGNATAKQTEVNTITERTECNATTERTGGNIATELDASNTFSTEQTGGNKAFGTNMDGNAPVSMQENIKNAFDVVRNTYRYVPEIFDAIDKIAIDSRQYAVLTSGFLRYKSDQDPFGYLINSFIKCYQETTASKLKNNWYNDAVYAVEINFEDMPKILISKHVYEDIARWCPGIRKTEHWGFYWPVSGEDKKLIYSSKMVENRLVKKAILKKEYKQNGDYWGLEYALSTTLDLITLTKDNINQVFETFKFLKTLQG